MSIANQGKDLGQLPIREAGTGLRVRESSFSMTIRGMENLQLLVAGRLIELRGLRMWRAYNRQNSLARRDTQERGSRPDDTNHAA